MFKVFTLIILFFGMTFIFNFKEYKKETISVNPTKTSDIWIINIPKIKLKEIVTLSSIRSTEINGIVLFKEYGRPNEQYSNTIIGAHSGSGPNALFNDIDKLDIGDSIIFYYRCVYFTYKVVKKYQVFETDLSPLNKGKNNNLLILITCVKNNSKKRLIIVSEQL